MIVPPPIPCLVILAIWLAGLLVLSWLEIRRLRRAIRRHRDQRGDDRCYLDDHELYRALPEGIDEADLRLHCPEVMLENCKRFIATRHDPRTPYVSPQREIERLEAELRIANRR